MAVARFGILDILERQATALLVALITNVTNGRADAYNVSQFTNGHAQLV
jgi:hypothetical protein